MPNSRHPGRRQLSTWITREMHAAFVLKASESAPAPDPAASKHGEPSPSTVVLRALIAAYLACGSCEAAAAAIACPPSGNR